MLLRIITLLCFISFYNSTNATPILIPTTSPIYTDQNAARSSYGIPAFTIDQNLVDIAQGITEQCNWSDVSWKSSAAATYASNNGVTSTSIGFNKGAASVDYTSISLWLNQKK
jgi:hypothetical protein